MSGSMGECNNCADQAIFHEGSDCFFGEASYVNLLLNFTLYAYSLAPTLTWICPRGVELQTSPTLTGSAHSAVTICIKYSLLSTVNTHTSLLTQSRSARVTPCEPLRVYSDIERSRLQLQWPTLYMIWILDKAKTAGGGVLYQMNLVLPKKNTSYLQNLRQITCYFMIWHVACIAHLVTGNYTYSVSMTLWPIMWGISISALQPAQTLKQTSKFSSLKCKNEAHGLQGLPD